MVSCPIKHRITVKSRRTGTNCRILGYVLAGECQRVLAWSFISRMIGTLRFQLFFVLYCDSVAQTILRDDRDDWIRYEIYTLVIISVIIIYASLCICVSAGLLSIIDDVCEMIWLCPYWILVAWMIASCLWRPNRWSIENSLNVASFSIVFAYSFW